VITNLCLSELGDMNHLSLIAAMCSSVKEGYSYQHTVVTHLYFSPSEGGVVLAHLTTTIQPCQTSSSAIISTNAFNYAVFSKCGRVLMWKINTLIWFQHIEEE